MQKKKIFIEISIPKPIKRRLIQTIAKWQDLPVKWMKEENLHMTMAFVGYVDESVIPQICQKVDEAVSEIESFDIDFDKIELGPDEDDPKVIWLTGEPNTELGILNENIERSLGMRPTSHKTFRPHVTLGRIRHQRWIELQEKPQISEKLKLSMTVEGVDVMESRGGGAEYFVLEHCPLA